MAMELTIRRATTDDIPIIMDITQEAFLKYSFDAGIQQQSMIQALHETPEDIAAELDSKIILLGEFNGQALGSIRYEFFSSGITYFSRLGVKLVAQSYGMGSALVNAVLEASLERGQHAVALHTNAKMYSLVRFYYGKGFYVHSTSIDRGYVRALLIRENDDIDTTHDYRQDIPSSC